MKNLNELEKKNIDDVHDESYDGYVFNYQESRDLILCECGYESCFSGHYWGPYQRRFFLIHYVIKGKGKVFIDGVEHQVGENQVFIQCPNVEYYYEADAEDPWEYVWVGFAGNEAFRLMEKIEMSLQNFIFTVKDAKTFLGYFNTILDEHKQKRTNEAKTLAYLYLIIAYLTDWYPKRARDKIKYENQMFMNILAYIELSYNSVSVSSIAKIFYYNRSSVFRLFHKKLGVSPSTFLELYRLHRACELIQKSKKTLTEIAYSIGYNNYNWFFTKFKSRLGVSPESFSKLSSEEQATAMQTLSIVEKAKKIFNDYEYQKSIT